MQSPWLIVGLGNPGTEYANTRHNIGFMVVDALAQRHRGVWSSPSPLWHECQIRLHGVAMRLIKPTTYMNASGRAAQAARTRYGIPVERCMAVVDEYNFPVGRVHLRSGGSDGGHNGLTSMIDDLGSPAFWRLRCGIDRAFGPGGLVQYVLGPFPPSEAESCTMMIDRACTAIEAVARMGAERAMQEINRTPPKPDA